MVIMEKKSKKQKKQCDQIPSTDDQQICDLLSDDLLRQVSERISYPDFLRFRAVCKNWHNAFIHKDYLQRRAIFVPHWQNNKTAMFMDLLTQETSSLSILPGCTKNGYTLCSNSGWLLFLNRVASKLVFCDPYSKVTVEVKLPDITWDSKVELAAFSTAPTSPDCVVFILWKMTNNYNRVKADFVTTTYRQEDQRWSICELRQNWQFMDRAVAYFDGKFYCVVIMNSSVLLGSFDVALRKWVLMGMESSTSPALSSPPFLQIYSNTYLVESDGELLLALPSGQQFKNGYSHRHIYRFDLSQNNWTRVQNLGNRVLILGRLSSFATPAVGVTRRFANKIIFINDWTVCHFWETEGEWCARKTVNL